MWKVKIDLAYRVAYLVDDQGTAQLAQSGVTCSSVDDALAGWGYARTPNGEWKITDILNAIDAVEFPVERARTRVGSAH